MKDVQMFKAARETNRFNKNQKVWIRLQCANHSIIWFKWRGAGRYVKGVISNEDKSIGEIETISVPDDFADRIKG